MRITQILELYPNLGRHNPNKDLIDSVEVTQSGNMTLKITLFIVATLIFTIILAVSQQKMNLSFEKISLPQLAPAIAVLLLFLVFRELPAKINLHLDTAILIKSLLAGAAPLVLFSITYVVGKQMNLSVKMTEGLVGMLPLMIGGMLIGALGEEIGWRSFLQPLMEKRNAVLFSSILVGIVWGLWHIGHYKNGPLYMIGFLLFTVSASMIVAWLMKGTEYNLIITALFHFSINFCFLAFFRNSMTDSKLMLVNGIVWAIPAIGLVSLAGRDFVR
ncbi:MAG: type II CAAX endopeptidase family protein [Bacteroidia bacterium]